METRVRTKKEFASNCCSCGQRGPFAGTMGEARDLCRERDWVDTSKGMLCWDCREKVPCPVCYGHKVVQKSKPPENGEAGHFWESTCDDCFGRGQILA